MANSITPRPMTIATARRQVLRTWARKALAANVAAVPADLDVNSATMEVLTELYLNHTQRKEVSPADVNEVISAHARKHGITLSDGDLLNVPASANAAPADALAMADTVASSVSGDTNAQAQSPAAGEDAAQSLLGDVMGHMARGGFTEAKGILAALLEKAARPAGRAAVIAPPSTTGPVGYEGPVSVADAFPDLAKERVSSELHFARYALSSKADPDYFWPEGSIWALSALADGQPVFLTGPAGTGKTSWAREVAKALGRPFVRVSCHDQTEGPTLTGMTVPTPNGGTEWRDGALVRAMRVPGAVILIDEPSVARPGALMVLQAVLDDERALVIEETGERVACADHVMLIVADNTNGAGDVTGAYSGTRQLNRAFMDRFGAVLPVGYLPERDESNMLHLRTGAPRKLCARLVRYANKTRQAALSGDVISPVGARALMRLALRLAAGAPPDVAFTLSVGASAAPEDAETLRQLWQADFADHAGIQSLV